MEATTMENVLDILSRREEGGQMLRSSGLFRSPRSAAPQVAGGPKQFLDGVLAVVLVERTVLSRARGPRSKRAASLPHVRGALSRGDWA